MGAHGKLGMVGNQAMEPVGIQPLSPEVPVRKEAPRGLTGRELLGLVLGIVAFVAGLVVLAVVMSAATALLHKALGPMWGNALGTIVFIILVFVMITATLLTMAERKWSALIQNRVGPNRARLPIPGLKDKPLAGIPHIGADVVKMLTKEELVPALGSKVIFQLAPAIAFVPAFLLFAVVPMSPSFLFWGEQIRLQVAAVDMGVLYIFAVASIAVLGTSLAGWASNNKFALLGGVRASAQMISYEVTLGLTLIGLMIVYGSLRLEEMTAAQSGYLFGWIPAWGVLYQPFAIVAYLAAASAEIKRAPFDMPEGESEIVGYFIEYSGLKFGLFMIAEFVEIVVFAGLFTALFFGGYHLPWGEAWLAARLPEWAMGIVYLTTFMAKTVFFIWLSITIRWTFPRFRYDQVMDLGWKMLLPLSLANVILTGIVTVQWGREGAMIFGLIQLAVLLFFIIGTLRLGRTGDETAIVPAGEPEPAPAHH